jgi:ketosteroid isomerase-like protein
MRRALTAAILLLAAFPLFAEANVPPSVDLPPELDRVLRDYEKAWMAGDAAALSALFTEDGFVLSNGKAPVRGRAAIRAAYANAGGPLVLRALAWSVDGSTGYIIGGYGSSKEKPDIGKFVLAVRKVDGRWLIAADMDNVNSSSRPAPAPTPAPTPRS